MDAIMGRFKVRIEETSLILKHEAGITFNLTIEETLGLFKFINAYRGTLISLKGDQDPETQKLTPFVKDDDKSDLQSARCLVATHYSLVPITKSNTLARITRLKGLKNY